MVLDIAEGDVITLLQKFRALQEERAYTYNIFHEGHKLYLASGPNYNFPQFRQLVNEVTQEFKRISEGIIAIEKKLKPINPKLSSIIQHLQEAEKAKLQLTAKLQLSEQRLLEEPEKAEDIREEIAQIRKSLHTVTETINDCIKEVKEAMHDYLNEDRHEPNLNPSTPLVHMLN